MSRRWLAGAALLLTACGGGEAGVPVGEAAPVVLAPPPTVPRSTALDTVYADTLGMADADSVGAPADSLVAPPQVEPSLAALQQAVRRDQRASLRDLAPGVPRADLDRLWVRVESGPFRDGLLALAARDLRRDGTARTARVVVGYDASGRVVPQDEADTDRTLAVRFDVVDGAYRIVGVDLP